MTTSILDLEITKQEWKKLLSEYNETEATIATSIDTGPTSVEALIALQMLDFLNEALNAISNLLPQTYEKFEPENSFARKKEELAKAEIAFIRMYDEESNYGYPTNLIGEVFFPTNFYEYEPDNEEEPLEDILFPNRIPTEEDQDTYYYGEYRGDEEENEDYDYDEDEEYPR